MEHGLHCSGDSDAPERFGTLAVDPSLVSVIAGVDWIAAALGRGADIVSCGGIAEPAEWRSRLRPFLGGAPWGAAAEPRWLAAGDPRRVAPAAAIRDLRRGVDLIDEHPSESLVRAVQTGIPLAARRATTLDFLISVGEPVHWLGQPGFDLAVRAMAGAPEFDAIADLIPALFRRKRARYLLVSTDWVRSHSGALVSRVSSPWVAFDRGPLWGSAVQWSYVDGVPSRP